MKNKWIVVAMIPMLGIATERYAAGTVVLSSLQNPTLQSLIALAGDGVTVGPDRFYNFDFIAGNGEGPASASQIIVNPAGPSGGGGGLQFVATWFAADGAAVSDIISYDVSAIAPADSPAWIDLFSNGTAPSPRPGTFTTSTLTAQTVNGVPAAPTLSTYDDGQTEPIDTTKPDINFATTTLTPQSTLEITDSVFADSTAPTSTTSGGLATITVIQNTFGAVPEPLNIGWMVPAIAMLLTPRGRRNKATPHHSINRRGRGECRENRKDERHLSAFSAASAVNSVVKNPADGNGPGAALLAG